MKIGELAQRSGVSVHTLRYYDGVVVPLSRPVPVGARNEPDPLQSCLLVLDAKIAGYAGEEDKHDDECTKPVSGRKPVRARQARALAD